MDILTSAAQSYMQTFHGFQNQFLTWGKWLFLSLATINIVLLGIQHAFDKHALSENMPDFIKQFLMMSLFYMLMLDPSWLTALLKTAEVMGSTLTTEPIDPSSIISTGIALANKVMAPIQKSNLLTAGFSLIILSIVYVVVLFSFLSIALDLALTLIITTALISAASFFLGFGALNTTSQIARQTLDVVLGNCVKLLAIYLVVAAGSQTLPAIVANVPTSIDQLVDHGLDSYAWITAASLLFWLVAKNLPVQMARIVTGAIQDTRGTETAAIAMAALQYARAAYSVTKLSVNGIGNLAKVARSTAYHAATHFRQSVPNTVSSRFKDINHKMSQDTDKK